MPKNKKILRRIRIKRSLRARLAGTSEKPRLCVSRSNKHIYAQLIDDSQGRTLAAASSGESEIAGKISGKSRTEVGQIVGEQLAQRAKDAGMSAVVFDRNGYLYHGRVKALADGARKGGLKF